MNRDPHGDCVACIPRFRDQQPHLLEAKRKVRVPSLTGIVLMLRPQRTK